jgi:2'-5' RNA ligase
VAHSVLQIPVPALERFVRERTAHHDPSFVSSDPAFGHAHVTALGPFLPQLDDGAADKVAQIAAGTAPFDFSLDRVATFPDGVIHLVPDPEEPFRDLTARLVEAFPQCPPYGGQFDDVRPHLTLDATADGVDEGTVRAALGSVVPAACRAVRLDLAWWESGGCRVLRSWPLGGQWDANVDPA